LKRFIGYCSIHKLNLFISKAVAEQSVTAFFFARAARRGRGSSFDAFWYGLWC